ncbi:MAG: 1-acyl-sn-glycerol-3-phosphate acyltransferase [Verrucomicrobiota bacterium]
MPIDLDNADPLFSLERSYPFFRKSPLRQKIARLLDRTLGLDQLSSIPANVPHGYQNPYQHARQQRGWTIDDLDNFSARIPKSGPTIVIANHPYGALDAFIASELTLTSRPDMRVFGNAVLNHPCHQHCFLPLEILDESPEARRRNLQSLRTALTHLKNGGCLLIFPAGEVERWRWSTRRIEEGPWTPHLARLAQKSHATILPTAFPGENPLWFHLPGTIQPTLRLLAMPRAFLNLEKSTIPFRTGSPIPPQNLPSNPQNLTAFLRKNVLQLANRLPD